MDKKRMNEFSVSSFTLVENIFNLCTNRMQVLHIWIHSEAAHLRQPTTKNMNDMPLPCPMHLNRWTIVLSYIRNGVLQLELMKTIIWSRMNENSIRCLWPELQLRSPLKWHNEQRMRQRKTTTIQIHNGRRATVSSSFVPNKYVFHKIFFGLPPPL